jgi:2,4-dienoyl-CoA reductase-like NADH-dependent reductase (Old Yellow Enzyme family)
VQYNKRTEQNMRVEDVNIEDIRKIQTDIIIAAQKFDYAGFDGIQLGLGNYYFLARFINPNFNTRTDKYGGSTINRLRIVLEIIKVIKENTNLHINCRLNAFDGTNMGMDIEETIVICQLLEKYGADSLQITRPRSPQFFTQENKEKNPLIEATEKISKNVSIPVILGGGANSQNQINDILNETDIDFISMQRPFVKDPSFLVDWQIEGNGVSHCITCNNCYWKKTSTCHIRSCNPEYY